PASIVTTNSRPWLQVKGYANETLSRIYYDVTNASGVLTNQQAFVVDQYYDTNTDDIIICSFQCFDIRLTNGVNSVTLRGWDRAGNMTTTNLTVVFSLDGDTNPPVVNLVWPQPGMVLCGTNFTLRGIADDETATVSAQIVSTNSTNVVDGLMERNGKLWVED